MIVRDRPGALRLLLTLRGSVLPAIWRPVAFSVLVATAATLASAPPVSFSMHLEPIVFSLIGMTLAIFLGFRNQACYERFREGRVLWGELLLASRTLTRQALVFIEPFTASERRRLVGLLLAAAHALRHELRGSAPEADLARWLDAAAVARVLGRRARVQALLLEVGGLLRNAHRAGALPTYLFAAMDHEVQRLAAVHAGCERIRNTPVPFAYTLLLHRTVFVYCVLLPFGLVPSSGAFTPVVAGVLAYTFFGLDAVGSQIEQPFGDGENQLPLSALCRTLETDLLEMLGESELPPPLEPVDYVLT